jgi:hypothetical protein
MLAIVSSFPLASRQVIRGGVLIDAVERFDDVVPSAGWVQTKHVGRTWTQAAQLLGVTESALFKQHDRQDGTRAAYWLQQLSSG